MIKKQFPRTILDLDGRPHIFELGSDSPLLNGEHCEVVSINPDSIRLALIPHPAHVVSFAPETFWQGLVGDQPTEVEAGQLFAHYLTLWMAQQACMQTITALQSLLAAGRLHEHQELFLPTYRFDSLTQQALESFDGTKEMGRLLARILKTDEETVTHWAQLAGTGTTASVNAVGKDTQTNQAVPLTEKTPSAEMVAQLDPHAEEDGEPVAEVTIDVHVEESPSSTWFRWTEEREQMLRDAIAPCGGLDQVNAAMIMRIANQFDWPWKSIQYKVSKWKRNRRGQNEDVSRVDEETVPQAEAHQGQELTLDLPPEETGLLADVSPESFFWDEEKIQQLTEAFLQSEAEGTTATCREIEKRFGWPLTKIANKVQTLRLPGQKQNAQRAAAIAALPTKMIRENELPAGRFLWRAVIDGEPTQWRLDYSYGNFPEYLQGKDIYYQDRCYIVDRIFIQEVRVSARNTQSADQDEIEALQASA